VGIRVRKVYGSVGVVFKGSGFYRTDSRAAASAAEASASSASSKAESKADAKSDSKSESKPAAEKKSEPAAAVPVPAPRTSSRDGLSWRVIHSQVRYPQIRFAGRRRPGRTLDWGPCRSLISLL